MKFNIGKLLLNLLVIACLTLVGCASGPYISQDGFEIYEHTQPPYAKGYPYHQVRLTNHKDAANPTWGQLKTFLITDETDQGIYGLRLCGDFAEELHNNAEIAGIRAAFVVVELEGEEQPHALNVFQTTDMGPVFVDCTGRGLPLLVPLVPFGGKIFGEPKSRDKVAYVQIGKPLGFISLEVVDLWGFRYAAYERWAQDKALFDLKGDRYEKQLGGRLFVPEPEYSSLMRQLTELERLADKLSGFWEPFAVVDKVSIYW